MPDGSTAIDARLLERIRPIDRGDRYEIPLDDALREEGLGEVCGGGTMLQHNGEIEYVDVDISLRDMAAGIPFVCRFLEECGAPKGSVLTVCDREVDRTKIPFGKTEGIGVYFDGVNLLDEVYRDCDITTVRDEFLGRLQDEGEIRGYWHGSTETAFYIYGSSASKMESLLADYIRTYPLCRGARVVPITPVGST